MMPRRKRQQLNSLSVFPLLLVNY